MSEPKTCPTCGLVNPPEAARCDCGYDLTAPSRPQPAQRRAARDLARRPTASAAGDAVLITGQLVAVLGFFLAASTALSGRDVLVAAVAAVLALALVVTFGRARDLRRPWE